MILLFIGLMCSGKSSVGKVVAKELNHRFVEMDALVLDQTGFSNVQEVYESRVSLWKESELQICRELSYEGKAVVACSGDIVENDLNFQYFSENAPNGFKVVYLSARPETLSKRLIASHSEVRMKDDEKIRKNVELIFEKRDALCRLHADHVIPTDGTDLHEVTQAVLKVLAP